MAKQVKVWTPKMRRAKSKVMKAYWRKRKGVAGPVAPLMADITAELRKSKFWKVEQQPPTRTQAVDRMAKLLKASRAVSAAPQSTVRQLDEKLAEVMGTIAKLRQVLADL